MSPDPTLTYQDVHFVLVGPPKTGTTWLGRCLREHPQIFCAHENVHLTLSPRKDNWAGWRRSFRGHNGEEILGDAAPTYSYFPGIPRRLAELNRDLRIIFSVRDPLDRCLSHYRHDLRMGLIPRDVSFYRLIQPHFFRDRYIDPGCYSKHVGRFLEHFPPEQIYLFPMPSRERDNQPELDDLCRYLGADPHPLPSASRVVYETVNPLSPRLHRQARQGRGFRKKLAGMVDPANRAAGRYFLSDPVNDQHRAWVRETFEELGERERFQEIQKHHLIPGRPRLDDWSV